MKEERAATPGDDPGGKAPAPPPAIEKRLRRTALSTGFNGVPGKTCDVCGYEGFRWQTKCPQGHPLA